MKWILVLLSINLTMTSFAKPRVNNYAKDFEKFWLTNKNKSDKEKLKAIKRDVFPKFKEFYDWKIQKWRIAGKKPDIEILKQLNDFESVETEFSVKNKSITSEIDQNLPAFLKTFPDFDQNFDIYIAHSLGDMDGGTRKIKGKMYFIFGIDGIVKYHKGMKTDVPFFHHELFHVYHFPRLVDKDELWVALWAEGLATYVSEVMNPKASVKDLMLDTPAGMYEECKKLKNHLFKSIESKLKSVSEKEYERYFLVSSKDKTVPKRAGYYIGYLIAKEVGKTYSIQEMSNFKEPKLMSEIHKAIDTLNRKPESRSGQ